LEGKLDRHNRDSFYKAVLKSTSRVIRNKMEASLVRILPYDSSVCYEETYGSSVRTTDFGLWSLETSFI